MITHLYIKTHNVTGLKYFGKTIQKNPQRYKGSGKYWKCHLAKYGNDVTTEILGSFDDIELCELVASEFSIKFNIVESDEWANLIPETLSGNFDALKSLPKEVRSAMARKGALARTKEDLSRAAKSRDPRTLSFLCKESREKAKQTAQKNKVGIYSDAAKENRRLANLKRIGTIIINNGITQMRCNKNEIPSGWTKGKVSK